MMIFDEIEQDVRISPLQFFCFEGISLRNISDEEHTISFNFLDYPENNFAEYFTLKVYKEEERGVITFYKENSSGEDEVVLVFSDLELGY